MFIIRFVFYFNIFFGKNQEGAHYFIGLFTFEGYLTVNMCKAFKIYLDYADKRRKIPVSSIIERKQLVDYYLIMIVI